MQYKVFYTGLRKDIEGFLGSSVVKNPPVNAGELGVVTIPWRTEWLTTPVIWPGTSHGQSSLAGCSPWGSQKSWT